MKKLKRKWAAVKIRLRDAGRVLFRQHYFLFSTNREVPPNEPSGYYDIEWQDMRRQDVFQIGTLCLSLLAEDDECQSLVDEANDLLK
jgi:hypothetical protein